MPLYKYELHHRMHTYRPKRTDGSILAPTNHALQTGAEVLIANAVIMTFNNRPQIALRVIDLEEPMAIDDLYVLAEEISPEVCTSVHEAANLFMCAVRRASTDEERLAATAHFNQAITRIGEILKPDVVPISENDTEIPPGHIDQETTRPSFELFPA